MKNSDFKLPPLTLILVKDSRIGGFTAYFRQFPEIIAEGETEIEAEGNLMSAVHDVFVYKSQISSDNIDSSMVIIEKSVNFSSESYA
jgi:predicted RNase H-like HicB family nuclease